MGNFLFPWIFLERINQLKSARKAKVTRINLDILSLSQN
jgi:hypothetical protein